jgi:SHS2 domain-containing protein
MRAFRYLPHTADMRFRAYGKGFREALENAGLALLSIMLDVKRIGKLPGKEGRISITESADTEEELVWFTLQDMLSKIDSSKVSAYALRISRLESSGGRLRLSGRVLYKRTKADYSMLSVKAVTPHGLEISRRNGSCSIQVVVDV